MLIFFVGAIIHLPQELQCQRFAGSFFFVVVSKLDGHQKMDLFRELVCRSSQSPYSAMFRGIPALPCSTGQSRRAPAHREVSIIDSGLTRPGLGETVLYLHSATGPGRGPCLTETVWAGSRERFLVLCRKGLNINREWGLLGRERPEREQREVLGLVHMY